MRRIADGFFFTIGAMLAIATVKTANAALAGFAKKAEESGEKAE